jgi:hypothetical protein
MSHVCTMRHQQSHKGNKILTLMQMPIFFVVELKVATPIVTTSFLTSRNRTPSYANISKRKVESTSKMEIIVKGFFTIIK